MIGLLQYRNYSVGTFNTPNTCTPICGGQRAFPQFARMEARKTPKALANFSPGSRSRKHQLTLKGFFQYQRF